MKGRGGGVRHSVEPFIVYVRYITAQYTGILKQYILLKKN